jgi:hypothetical protein
LNKKGFVQDMIFLAVIMLVFAITAIFGSHVFNEVNDGLQASDSMDNNSKDLIQENVDRYSGVWDGLFLALVIIIGISVVVAVSLLPTHPLFFFAGVIIAAFALIGIAIMGNAYDDVSQETVIADDVAGLPVINWLMSHIVEVLAVIIIIGLIVMYAGANR